jgi:hypothetical protein
MGSRIDAPELVSCMTLFQPVARALAAADLQPRFAALAAAAADGYGRRAYTAEYLRQPRA